MHVEIEELVALDVDDTELLSEGLGKRLVRVSSYTRRSSTGKRVRVQSYEQKRALADIRDNVKKLTKELSAKDKDLDKFVKRELGTELDPERTEAHRERLRSAALGRVAGKRTEVHSDKQAKELLTHLQRRDEVAEQLEDQTAELKRARKLDYDTGKGTSAKAQAKSYRTQAARDIVDELHKMSTQDVSGRGKSAAVGAAIGAVQGGVMTMNPVGAALGAAQGAAQASAQAHIIGKKLASGSNQITTQHFHQAFTRGSADTIDAFGSAILGYSPLKNEAYELLGPEGASQLLAHTLQDTVKREGLDMQTIMAELDAFRAESEKAVTGRGIERVRRATEYARHAATEAAKGERGEDSLFTRTMAEAITNEKLRDARRSLGMMIGGLEATESLKAALLAKQDRNVSVLVREPDVRKVQDRARGLGVNLKRTDVKHIPGKGKRGGATRISAPVKRFDAVVNSRPPDLSDIQYRERLRSIRQGKDFDKLITAETKPGPFMAHPLDANQAAGKLFLNTAGSAVLGFDPGVGKAALHTEPILTPSGWTTFGEVKVGDEVIASNGLPAEVLGVYPQGEREIFRVQFTDGAWLDCDAEHLWTVRHATNRPWRTITTSELRFDRDRRPHVPRCAAVELPERELPIEPYTLGVLLGDGCLGVPTIAVTTDRELVGALSLPEGITPRFRRNESADGTVATYGLTQGHGASSPNPLRETLFELGLAVGSPEKHVPPGYLLSSRQQRTALLAGLLDSDGHPLGTTIEFASSARALTSAVRELALSLGGMSSSIKTSPTSVNGERKLDRHRIHISLPFNPFRLERKAAKWRPRSRGEWLRTIDSVTPIGRGEAVCIRVAAPDSLFVTRDYVLTHNTHTALAAAKQVMHDEPDYPHKVLIVAPTAVLKDWRDTIELQGPQHTAQIVGEGASSTHGKRRQLTGDATFTIVSYESLRSMRDAVAGEHSIVIADELQKGKNAEAQLTQALLEKVTQGRGRHGDRMRFYGLTGTPIEKRASDLHSMIHVARVAKGKEAPDASTFGTEKTGRSRVQIGQYEHITRGDKLAAFRRGLDEDLFRMSSEAAGNALPEPDRFERNIELKGGHRTHYQRLVRLINAENTEHARRKAEGEIPENTPPPYDFGGRDELLKALYAYGGDNVLHKAVVDDVTSSKPFSSGGKTYQPKHVIFSTNDTSQALFGKVGESFDANADGGLAAELRKAKVKVFVGHGKMPNAQNTKNIADFLAYKGKAVFVTNDKNNAGISLHFGEHKGQWQHGATHLHHFSLPVNNATIQQREARVLRKGATEKVRYHTYNAGTPIETRIRDQLETELRTQELAANAEQQADTLAARLAAKRNRR